MNADVISVEIAGLNFNPSLNALIDELAYQNDRWGGGDCPTESGLGAFDRSVDEYTLYINRYAQRMAEKNGVGPDEFEEKIHLARKIAALAIACIAQHGPLTRAQETALHGLKARSV